MIYFLQIPYQTPYVFLFFLIRSTRPAHIILLNMIILLYYSEMDCNIIFRFTPVSPCSFFLEVFQQKFYV
jgi:hypothetical protein